MKILLFSTLYPNNAQPGHAPFVEQRLLQLLKSGCVQAKVVAPIPWFPINHKLFGKYATYTKVNNEEVRSGVTIHHPRFPVIPKIGMSLAPFLMALWALPEVLRLRKQGYQFDLIDAHFVYPDGIAAILIGKLLKVPVVVTGRGSDITLHQKFFIPRLITKYFIRSAAALVTVCEALKRDLQQLGITKPAVSVLRNGVDLDRFCEVDREKARAELDVTGTVLISVGRLAAVKGQELTIKALEMLPDMTLILVGDGPDESDLKALATKLGVIERVRFMGNQPQDKLKNFYSAADIMVLSSSREGWANVLLESMACGTPVVATEVGGTNEVVTSSDAGVLIKERTPQAISSAVHKIISAPIDRLKVRKYAEHFNWDSTSLGQKFIFSTILGKTSKRGCLDKA